jgi:hypothetical protein
VTGAQLFRYAEAYCLIPYVTPDGEREVIWNSRDGGSPARVISLSGVPATFTGDTGDVTFAPLHVPAVGDRIFVDLTEARARVLAARRVERVQARERAGELDGLPPLDVVFPTREAAVESAFLDIYKPGVPDILVVTAGYLDQLQGERAAAATAVATAETPSAVAAAEAPSARRGGRRSMYYDRNGQPITLETWSALVSDRSYQQLAQTQLDERILVSTVWLGIDHAWWPDSLPLIFETMVFYGVDPYRRGGECERYHTEAEALAGHARMVAAVTAEIESDKLPKS